MTVCKNCGHEIVKRKFTNLYGTTERWLHKNNHSIECQDCAESGFGGSCYLPLPKPSEGIE